MAQQFILSSKRKLEYLITGDPDGFPLVYIHGTPGAYNVLKSLQTLGEKKGLKVISLSRAGYGGSTRNQGRSVADAVKDIEELLSHLKVEKCAVMGWSGGGPHAIGCTALLPQCRAVLSIAGVGPYGVADLDFLAGQGEDNIQEFGAALQGEAQLQQFCNAQREGLMGADAEAITEAMSSLLPEVDKKALKGGELGAFLVDTLHEALKEGCDGWVDDDLAFIRPWGFDLSEVKVPILVYQGSLDLMVPYAHGKWLAKNLPQDKVRKYFLEGEGHVSIFMDYQEQMVDELVSIASQQG